MPGDPIRAPSPIRPLTRSATEIADSLNMAMDPKGAMAVLDARLDAAPNDFAALWRATATAFALGVISETRDERLRWLHLGDRYGDRGLALRPNDPVALEWAIAAKGRLAIEDHNPVTTARLGKETHKLAETLLAEDPDNAVANDALGKLIVEIRKLSWSERILARVLIGGDVTSTAHWSDAERFLKRAVEADPEMVLYHMDLGDAYRLQGKDTRALHAYRDGLAQPDRYPVDAYYKRQIQRRVRALEHGGGGGS